jgi:hypothetical protein
VPGNRLTPDSLKIFRQQNIFIGEEGFSIGILCGESRVVLREKMSASTYGTQRKRGG